MSARPGRIKAEFDVRLARPRPFYDIRFDPMFKELQKEIWAQMSDEHAGEGSADGGKIEKRRSARLVVPGTQMLEYVGLDGRIVVFVLLVGLWELLSGRAFNSFWLSKPSLIAGRIAEMLGDGDLWFHMSATLQEAIGGLAIGMIGERCSASGSHSAESSNGGSIRAT